MSLNHPNIAQMYGCFCDQDHLYLVCEYATDHNLFDLVAASRQHFLPCSHVVSIVNQLCSAISCIHQAEVIHRDIKPENILITMGGVLKVCDFGWSVCNSQQHLRATFCGTPLYLAPEMVAQNNYDQSVDTWAVGILTYELLAQRNPFNITKLNDLTNIVI